MGNAKTVDDPWTAADRTRRTKGIQELQKTMDSIVGRNVRPNSPPSEPTVTPETKAQETTSVVMAPTPLPDPQEAHRKMVQIFGKESAEAMYREVGGVARPLEKKNPDQS